MESLTRKTEEKYYKGTIKYIMGIDEAGRGPLAGPVVAAACIIRPDIAIPIIDGIKDSKATTEAQREVTYTKLINTPGIYWGVSVISAEKIDEINILQASLMAMRNSAQQIMTENPQLQAQEVLALVDGNKLPKDMPVACEYVIKGDASMFSIAAASIIAKVTRDRLMVALDKIYPEYKFAQHKGYPVPAHRAVLNELGPSEVHRFSYSPVKVAAQKHGYVRPASASATAAAATAAATSAAAVAAICTPDRPIRKTATKAARVSMKLILDCSSSSEAGAGAVLPPMSPPSPTARTDDCIRDGAVTMVTPPGTPERLRLRPRAKAAVAGKAGEARNTRGADNH